LVKFGTLTFPHVLDVSPQSSYRNIEQAVPTRTVAYREPQTTLGRVITVSGEIRETEAGVVSATIQDIRDLNDGVARSLDLEDGDTAAFYAFLTDPEFELNAENWSVTSAWIWGQAIWGTTKWGIQGQFRAPYSVKFLESQSP
jgi:hypothetical protein